MRPPSYKQIQLISLDFCSPKTHQGFIMVVKRCDYLMKQFLLFPTVRTRPYTSLTLDKAINIWN